MTEKVHTYHGSVLFFCVHRNSAAEFLNLSDCRFLVVTYHNVVQTMFARGDSGSYKEVTGPSVAPPQSDRGTGTVDATGGGRLAATFSTQSRGQAIPNSAATRSTGLAAWQATQQSGEARLVRGSLPLTTGPSRIVARSAPIGRKNPATVPTVNTSAASAITSAVRSKPGDRLADQ